MKPKILIIAAIIAALTGCGKLDSLDSTITPTSGITAAYPLTFNMGSASGMVRTSATVTSALMLFTKMETAAISIGGTAVDNPCGGPWGCRLSGGVPDTAKANNIGAIVGNSITATISEGSAYIKYMYVNGSKTFLTFDYDDREWEGCRFAEVNKATGAVNCIEYSTSSNRVFVNVTGMQYDSGSGAIYYITDTKTLDGAVDVNTDRVNKYLNGAKTVLHTAVNRSDTGGVALSDPMALIGTKLVFGGTDCGNSACSVRQDWINQVDVSSGVLSTAVNLDGYVSSAVAINGNVKFNIQITNTGHPDYGHVVFKEWVPGTETVNAVGLDLMVGGVAPKQFAVVNTKLYAVDWAGKLFVSTDNGANYSEDSGHGLTGDVTSIASNGTTLLLNGTDGTATKKIVTWDGTTATAVVDPSQTVNDAQLF